MDFSAARQAMVECQLATNNVVSENILQAMGRIPREEFVPDIKKDAAYLDEDIFVGEGRYLMEPMVFARMVQALSPRAEEVVLDVGSASGYGSAVLSAFVQTVVAVEPHKTLMEYAVGIWRKLNICNIGELQEPIDVASKAHAPYDMILINGAVAEIPDALVGLLKDDSGRLVCVLREDPTHNGQAVLIKKTPQGGCSISPLFDANIPYLEEYAPKESFLF